MKTLEVRIEKEHLVTDGSAGLELIDTGSPITIDTTHPLMDGIKENTGLDLDRLVGTDELFEGNALTINIQNGEVILEDLDFENINEEAWHSDGREPSEEWYDYQLGCVKYAFNTPCVHTNMGWMAIDTGAMQSFVKKDWLGDCGAELNVIERRREFLPTGENFMVDIIEMDVTLDGVKHTIQPAIMPEEFEMVFDNWRVNGIIGLDILGKDDFRITPKMCSPYVAFDHPSDYQMI
jgi:hypothetical protein